MAEDYYKLLGVASMASHEEIKKTFQKLILKYHPDKTTGIDSQQRPNDTEIFMKIQEAKDVLLDPDKRKEYDRKLKENEVKKFQGPLFSSETLDTLDYEENESYYFMECRCGGLYVLEENEIDRSKDFLYVQCDNCTFYIEIQPT